MRIVGGTHKGRQLRVPAGDTVRPTTDRVREALFSMLNSGRFGRRIQQAHVLDAYAGSGAMGIEALSRGAEHATFFDNAGPSIAAIQANLEVLDLKSNARVIRTDVARPPKATRSCDIVFLDPPYRDASAVSKQLTGRTWVIGRTSSTPSSRWSRSATRPPSSARISARFLVLSAPV